MIRFDSDYVEGCHPDVLAALTESNAVQTVGYGEDPYCQAAGDLIRDLIELPGADVHFVTGGTQANVMVITHLLRSYEGVVSAETGHINVHETGAVEASGHKVLTIPSSDGKVHPAPLRDLVRQQRDSASAEHMVRPGMVYISQTTETGTVYSQAELDALHGTCQELGLPLYIDGARLGYALTADQGESELQTFASVARSCEVFTIGATKCGALFGEAVVFPRPGPGRDFRYTIKQKGGMLAKGRLLGIQFDALLRNGTYLEIAASANRQAERIRAVLPELGIEQVGDSPSNQLFVALPNDWLGRLERDYAFDDNGPLDEKRRLIRICTSWATRDESVESLLADLRRCARLHPSTRTLSTQ